LPSDPEDLLPDAEETERPPRTLGRYEIVRELGRGMMGRVFEATDPALGRRVALKTIRLAYEVPAGERASFEKRFLAEARAAAALQHPGIVVVHDVGRDEATGTLFIALERLPGRTLAEETADGRPMEWTRALQITRQLAEALHHAHGQGIVHRDIKPANVMLLPSGAAKLMDFGIAKLPASQLTVAGEFFGTPSYMSPEQAGGAAVDARSDLFSLGCVAYQLLTGRRAFDGPSLPAILLRVMKEEPPAPSRVVRGLPPAVDAVVGRAMAKDLAARYPDGRALAEDVEDALAGRPLRHASARPAPPPGAGVGAAAEQTRVSRRPPPRENAGLQDLPLPEPADAAPLEGERERAPRRRRAWLLVAAAAGLSTLGFLGALAVPWGERPAVLPLPTLAPPPGVVEVDLVHNLKAGTVKIWVDDELVLEEALEGRVSRKVLSFKLRKGTLSQDLEVEPGERMLRVHVQGDGFDSARRIRGTFESGGKRRLRVEVGGLIKRELTLLWGT
jgi:eukaryotic-like serine/threonine-protein kinase